MEEKQQDNDQMDAIDIKLQHLLGHFLKYFEGKPSAKNLSEYKEMGSRFGGYGSFLPSPSVLLHPRTLSIRENNSTKNLPNKPVVKQTQLVAASSRGTVLSANAASAANNILSGLVSDHVAKSRQTAVTVVNNSREMKDSQLEEGEIPSDQDHESNCDPDVAFSYIDAKLQNVPGHCQKDFEGEISAENLGSKFGGYRSFLTNHQGSPPKFLQPETLPIAQNNSTHNLPNNGLVKIMASHKILGGSLATPLPDIRPQFTETDEKVFPKETENLIVKTEFQKDTSTNKNDFELVKEFRGLKGNKAISNGNKTKSTDIRETYCKFGKNAPNNLKRPTETSSKDVCHGWLEKEIIGESGKSTLKTSDAYMKGTKEASKDKIHQFSNSVICDACKKWRLLPSGVELSSLPKKWFCQMLYWLPDMNRCDVSEDSTTQAVNGMYSIQAGQCQVGANKEPLQHPGAPLSEALFDNKQAESTEYIKHLRSSVISSVGKKEELRIQLMIFADSINHSSSLSKKNKPSSVRSNSSTDVVQKRLEKVQVGKGILQQDIKGNGAVMGIEKLKQEEKSKLKHNASNRAESNVGQGKRKNEVKAGVHKSLKKIKARGAIDGSNSELSTVPRESSKVDSWHEALIPSVKPFVKSKSSTDVLQNPLEKNQPGTCILSQEIKGNGAAMGMHNYKQGEIWKMKQNASNRGEGTPGQGKRKNEDEAAVQKPLKKAKARQAIHGSNNELSRALKESSKIDNLHIAEIHSTNPLSTIVVAGRVPVGAVAASPVKTELEQAAGNTALKEARDLKRTANRLKMLQARGGSGYDTTSLYFEAALKFLQAASLLKPSNLENAEHGEIPQFMTLYTDAVRLFEYCASTYERNKEMAAAALAYKCMGVTHMRVVASKTSCLTRYWHELPADFQEAPLGELSTISSSYIDNSNKHPLMDKSLVNPSKLDGSPHVAGNHVISAKHHSHFLRVMQYTKDFIAGVEAFTKSEIAFSAAIVNSPDGNKGTDKMSEVKRVIDFGFQDIDRLLRLVRIAKEAIND